MFESVVGGDVFEHFHFASRSNLVFTFREIIVQHQAAIVKFNRVRPIFPCSQTIVEIVQQRVCRDIRNWRCIELVHVTDVAASVKK